MTVTVVGPAIPLFMIGDCHTLAYSDMIFEFAENRYVTRAKYCRGLSAQTFTDASGNLQPALIEALVSELLISRTPDGLLATHRVLDGDTLAEGIARERTRTAPVICVSAGDADLRGVFLPGFKTLDFELPAPLEAGLAPPPAASEIVPYRVVRAYVERLLEPLFAGLRSLAALGFKNLYLHALPPPTTDDALFETTHGFRLDVNVRYKATRLFNAVLADFSAADPRVRYVDTWPATTIGGRLDPAFALDGIHLNRRASTLTVEYILHDLARRRSRSDDHNYQSAARTARAAANVGVGATPEVRERFASEGLLRFDIGAERAAHLRSLVKTGLYQAEAPQTGWAYDPLEPNFSYGSRPTTELLVALAAIFFESEMNDVLSACFGYDATLLNVRVFQALGHETRFDGPRPMQFAPLTFPPDVFRGVLYLDDVTDPSGGPLVVRSGDRIGMIPGAAGTLLIFDPHRIAVQPPAEAPARANNLDLLFGPRSPGSPARVIAAPGNALWPIDPLDIAAGDALVVEVRPR